MPLAANIRNTASMNPPPGVHVLEVQGLGRTEQTAKVKIEVQYTIPVDAYSLPARVPSLNGRIKGADAFCFISVRGEV